MSVFNWHEIRRRPKREQGEIAYPPTGGSKFSIQIFAKKVQISLLETQKQLVTEMEEQEKIIEANKKLIGIMEQKIAEVLGEI